MWPMTWFIESRPSLSWVEVESLYLYINRHAFVLLGVPTSEFASRSVRRGNNKEHTRNPPITE